MNKKKLRKIAKITGFAMGGILLLMVLTIAFIALFVREHEPITVDIPSPQQNFGIQIGPDPTLASIDVFEVAPEDFDQMQQYGQHLLAAASQDTAFQKGVLLYGLPAQDQPLHELGWVPKKAWVAIYAQWNEGSPQPGLASTARGKDILQEVSSISAWADSILQRPQISLYVPTLMDATGELCNHQICDEGQEVGPIITLSNIRATFINIFRTMPAKQEELLQTTYSIMPTARQHEGYLRTALHKSLDGKRVVNVGQYESYRNVADMYYHLKTLQAFGRVFFKEVTPPLFCLGNFCIGDYPRLRTYYPAEVKEGRVYPAPEISDRVQTVKSKIKQ